MIPKSGCRFSEKIMLKRSEWGCLAMRVQGTRLEATEKELKQLMADVTRAMEKAEQAVARIAYKGAAPADDQAASAPSQAA
jgi:hypothetical protein